MDIISNAIDYGTHVDDSIIRTRNQKTYPAQRGAPMLVQDVNYRPTIIQLTVGVEYIDPWNSWLEFGLAGYSRSYQGNTLPSSFLNFIKRITLTDRSGVELDRVENLNILYNTHLRSKFGDTYMDSTGFSLYDYKDASSVRLGKLDPATGQDDPAYSPTNRVMIPLAFLSGLFRTPNLLPPFLMEGLTMRIDWEKPVIALVQKLVSTHDVVTPFASNDEVNRVNLEDNQLPTYVVSYPFIVADGHILAPEAHETLHKQYVEVGLPLKFQNVTKITELSDLSYWEDHQINIPIKQSFSRATKLIAHSHVVPKDFGFVPSQSIYPVFKQQTWVEGTGYVININGVKYPHQETKSQDHAYWYHLMAYGKNRLYSDEASALQRTQFKSDVAPTLSHDLTRAVYSQKEYPNANQKLSLRSTSGIRVDGVNPVTLRFTLGQAQSSNINTNPDYPNEFITHLTNQENAHHRDVIVWVENERYLLLKTNGTVVVK